MCICVCVCVCVCVFVFVAVLIYVALYSYIGAAWLLIFFNLFCTNWEWEIFHFEAKAT